jgi:regulatory protein
MSPHIIRIEDAGPDRKARRLVFDDGSEPRMTSASVAKALGLEEGLDLPMDALETTLQQAEAPRARERALQLLEYRERSIAELTRKLRDSGYGTALVLATVARCAELGLVDDERFAEAWVRSRTSAGHGSRRIRRELAEKGVSPETIAVALEGACAPDQELARARAALRGQRALNRKDRDRLVRRLVARGFDLPMALQAVGEVGDESERSS